MSIQHNDIVQITNPDHKWFRALIIVDEIKSFGIRGYAVMPSNDDIGCGDAYIRLQAADYELVGRAIIVAAE